MASRDSTRGLTPDARQGADMSERVSWTSCPSCGERAAVGLTGDEVAEFDCASGCKLTAAQLDELDPRRDPRSED